MSEPVSLLEYKFWPFNVTSTEKRNRYEDDDDGNDKVSRGLNSETSFRDLKVVRSTFDKS